APVWLPAGPRSPDSDGTPDPASVYDRLRTPDRCADALPAAAAAAPDDEWRVLAALARACLAVRGVGGGGWGGAAREQAALGWRVRAALARAGLAVRGVGGGDWEVAAREHAARAGRPLGCKGRAAYAVLGGLLEFHRAHPAATVRPVSPSRGGTACDFRVASVRVGGDGGARPGEPVTVELDGAFFDPGEFARAGEVSVGGVPATDPAAPGGLAVAAGPGGRLTVTVGVPAEVPAGTPVDVVVRYADARAVREGAVTVVTVLD